MEKILLHVYESGWRIVVELYDNRNIAALLGILESLQSCGCQPEFSDSPEVLRGCPRGSGGRLEVGRPSMQSSRLSIPFPEMEASLYFFFARKFNIRFHWVGGGRGVVITILKKTVDNC